MCSSSHWWEHQSRSWLVLARLFHQRAPAMPRMTFKASNWYIAVAAVLFADIMGGCRSDPAFDQVHTPTHVEFEELFALEDTIRLDTTVLIGSITMLDVNSKGEFLVLDRQGEGVHVFSQPGGYLRTLSITDCNPEATFGFSAQLTFLSDSQVFILTSKGALVFDESGRCTQSNMAPEFATDTWAACLHRDTIFAMSRSVPDGAMIRAYDMDLAFVDQFPLPAPRFPRRASVSHPHQGRAMSCFDNDIWWVYGESFDVTPRLRRGDLTRFKPNFYIERERDYPEVPLVDQSNFREITQLLGKAEAEASSVLGVFALDETTRLVMYGGIRSDNGERGMGALVASHKDDMAGVSTLFPKFPGATKQGNLYFVEDPEDHTDGEFTNPLIIRYQFTPPKDWAR